MLRLYRRHRVSCGQTSERYRRCACPVYVEGTLAGEIHPAAPRSHVLDRRNGPGWLQTNNLRALADVTQQLYVRLPSYSAWHRAEWEAIHARRKARADANQVVAGAGPPGQLI